LPRDDKRHALNFLISNN